MKKFLLLCLAFSLFLSGCGSPAAQPAAKAKVSLGMLRLTSSAPLFIALEKGFFAAENLEIDPQWFDAAQPIAVATASSKIDVGATGITASLFNMAASGQNLAIVADKGREQKGFSSSALMAGTEAYNQGVNSIESLKGKRIGLTQKGSTFHYMLGRMLEAKGLKLEDVTIVPLGKLSAVMAVWAGRGGGIISLHQDGCSIVSLRRQCAVHPPLSPLMGRGGLPSSSCFGGGVARACCAHHNH